MKAVRSAEYNLGNLLRRRGDLQEAEHWYDRAANAGHHGAETNLGHILQLRGTPEEAERWWRRAASAGNHDAQYNLGVLLKVNRPGIDGGSGPWRGWSHVSPEEVSPRAS
jgi:TPR repeat protein